jgi:hypothetical protein
MAQAPASDGESSGLVYSQSTGQMSLDGKPLARGYSGNGPGKNNPAMQTVEGVGPIPQGTYTVGHQFHSHKTGAGAMRLTPLPGTQTYGRKDFELHGERIVGPPGQASDGCIILPPAVRRQLNQLPNRTLTVTQ